MKISVIIPAYNEEKFIGQAISALQKQDHPDFEIIVVNNNSTDNTESIAKSYGVTVVAETKKGTMAACECGRHIAKGEIIVRMDADCIPHSDWLTRGARYFKNEKVSIVSGPYDYYDYNFVFRLVSLAIQAIFYVPVNIILRLMRYGGVSIGGNTFLRASKLNDIGGFNTNLEFYGDDTDLAKKMSSIGKCIFSMRVRIPTSARRFKKEGVIKLQLKYIYHFIDRLLRTKTSQN